MSSVNGVNGVSSYQPTNGTDSRKQTAKSSEAAQASATQKESEAAVYEKSEAGTKKVYKPDTATIAKMKADAEERTASLRSLVEKMMLKQGQTITSATDYLMALKNGTLEIDDDTREQAQEDISENGYWGVEQTSDRLVSFAKALSGEDPSKAEMLMNAIEKGFKQATEAWGDELPELCSKTLEAVREKMQAWKNGTDVTAPAAE